MVKEDHFLLRILTILGISLSGYCLKSYEKYLSIIIKTLTSIFIIHWFSSFLYRIITQRSNELGEYVYLSMPMQLFLIRYFLIMQGENICCILQKLYSYRNSLTRISRKNCFMLRYKKECFKRANNYQYLVKHFAIFLILLPCILATIVCALDKRTKNSIWTFGHEVRDKIILRILSFYDSILYYSFCTFFVFITFFLSIIFYRCSEALRGYNKLLHIYAEEGKIEKRIDFIKEYFQITQILRNLDQALSYPSLIIIIYGLEMIFQIFLYALEHMDTLL